jgi:hypothetical protein
VTKYNLKEKNIYFGSVSEVSVPGHLTQLFLGQGEAEHHNGEHVAEKNCSSHGSWKAESQEEGAGNKI